MSTMKEIAKDIYLDQMEREAVEYGMLLNELQRTGYVLGIVEDDEGRPLYMVRRLWAVKEKGFAILDGVNGHTMFAASSVRDCIQHLSEQRDYL